MNESLSRSAHLKQYQSADRMNGSDIVIAAVLEMINEGGSYPLKGTGYSMMPFINDKDTLILTSLAGRKIKIGDVLLYERDNGKFVIHRVYKVKRDGTFEFVGDNQYKAEKGIRQDQLKAYVTKVIHNGKEIDCKIISVRLPMILYMWYRVKIPFISYRIRCLREKLQQRKTMHHR